MISVLTKANPKGYSSIALEDLTSFVSNTAVLVQISFSAYMCPVS